MAYHIQGFEDKSTRQEAMEKYNWGSQVLNQAELPENKKARTLPASLTVQKSLHPLLQWHYLCYSTLHYKFLINMVWNTFLFCWLTLVDCKGIGLDLQRKTEGMSTPKYIIQRKKFNCVWNDCEVLVMFIAKLRAAQKARSDFTY